MFKISLTLSSILIVTLLGGCVSSSRKPASGTGDIGSSTLSPSPDTLAELIRKAVLESNPDENLKKLWDAQEALIQKRGTLLKALSLEGLSEDVQQLLIRDIKIVSKDLDEVTRSIPEERFSRQYLGLKHIQDLIEIVKKECPKSPIDMKDSVISFPSKSGTVYGIVSLNDTYITPPYINFINKDIGVRLDFEMHPKYRKQKLDFGGDAMVFFDKKTGRLKTARFTVFGYESPLPGRALENKLPLSMQKFTEYKYACDKAQ